MRARWNLAPLERAWRDAAEVAAIAGDLFGAGPDKGTFFRRRRRDDAGACRPRLAAGGLDGVLPVRLGFLERHREPPREDGKTSLTHTQTRHHSKGPHLMTSTPTAVSPEDRKPQPQPRRRRLPSARRRPGLGMALCIAVAIPCGFDAASAQQSDAASGRSWSLSAWAQGAWQMPNGRLATVPSNLPDRPLDNSVSDLRQSLVISAGADVDFPDRDLGIRLGFEATASADATGQIGACAVATGPVCEPEVVPTSIRGVSAHIRAYRGNSEWPVRPVVGAGVGLRKYSFVQPDCPSRTAGAAREVCNLVEDMFQDPGAHVVFRGMVGARAKRNRYVSEATLSVGVGKFNGGTQRVNGAYYADIRLELLAGVRVF